MLGNSNTIAGILEGLAGQNNAADGDFTRDGLRCCGVCREPKQAVIDWFPDAKGRVSQRIVPVCCRCVREMAEREKAEDKKRQFSANMREMAGRFEISDGREKRWIFAADDGRRPQISRVLREYVERWGEMRADSIGILLYGSVGAGKSFFAGCVVNALLENMIPAAMTTTPRLLGILQGSRDRRAVLDHLQLYRALVLDDLGAERETSYGSEQIFNVIDTRYRSGLPLIVTTNIPLSEMRGERDYSRRRIYDRVLEMCPITLQIDGESRRGEIAENRRQKAREILRGATA